MVEMNVFLEDLDEDPAEGARQVLCWFGDKADEVALGHAAFFMAEQNVERWRYWKAVRAALKTSEGTSVAVRQAAAARHHQETLPRHR